MLRPTCAQGRRRLSIAARKGGGETGVAGACAITPLAGIAFWLTRLSRTVSIVSGLLVIQRESRADSLAYTDSDTPCNGMVDMPSDSVRFSGHQSFSLRNTWITKGVMECSKDPSIFRAPDALVLLGVGKNMVDAIKYWCLATRVLEDHSEQRFSLQPTPIGHRLFGPAGWDRILRTKEPFGSCIGCWQPIRQHDTAYLLFNEFSGLEFGRTQIEEWIAKRAAALGANVAATTLRRDVGVFLRSYAGGPDRFDSSVEDVMDCPLAELGLIYEERADHTYAFARGPKDSLPDEIFAYALWDYAVAKEGQRSFTFDELAYQTGSPGRIFKLDETALAERLENLAELTDGAWQPTETAGYRQYS